MLLSFKPMRYLSLMLLGPWLLLLAWAYWLASKRSRMTRRRKLYDVSLILVSLAAAFVSALAAYDGVAATGIGSFGRESGGIWRQVMPALYGYGAFALTMVLGLMAQLAFRTRRRGLREQ